MVMLRFLKLYDPVPRLMARNPRMQEVMHRIRQEPHRHFRAGPRQQAHRRRYP